VDAKKLEAVIEWTHFKPKQEIYLRGDEWYLFSPAGLIREIRAYYACPTSTAPVKTHELGDFEYAPRGYPLSPPPVKQLSRARDPQ
jgi:methyltransferase